MDVCGTSIYNIHGITKYLAKSQLFQAASDPGRPGLQARHLGGDEPAAAHANPRRLFFHLRLHPGAIEVKIGVRDRRNDCSCCYKPLYHLCHIITLILS